MELEVRIEALQDFLEEVYTNATLSSTVIDDIKENESDLIYLEMDNPAHVILKKK